MHIKSATPIANYLLLLAPAILLMVFANAPCYAQLHPPQAQSAIGTVVRDLSEAIESQSVTDLQALAADSRLISNDFFAEYESVVFDATLTQDFAIQDYFSPSNQTTYRAVFQKTYHHLSPKAELYKWKLMSVSSNPPIPTASWILEKVESLSASKVGHIGFDPFNENTRFLTFAQMVQSGPNGFLSDFLTSQLGSPLQGIELQPDDMTHYIVRGIQAKSRMSKEKYEIAVVFRYVKDHSILSTETSFKQGWHIFDIISIPISNEPNRSITIHTTEPVLPEPQPFAQSNADSELTAALQEEIKRLQQLNQNHIVVQNAIAARYESITFGNSRRLQNSLLFPGLPQIQYGDRKIGYVFSATYIVSSALFVTSTLKGVQALQNRMEASGSRDWDTVTQEDQNIKKYFLYRALPTGLIWLANEVLAFRNTQRLNKKILSRQKSTSLAVTPYVSSSTIGLNIAATF